MSKAPNFRGEFPEAGARIGPVWQEMWDHLESGEWMLGRDLIKAHATIVVENTVSQLLHSAAKAGVIEMKVISKHGKFKKCEYRRNLDSEEKKDV